MKRIVIVSLSLTITYLSAVWLVGEITQREITKLADQGTFNGISTRLASYERGFFSSEVKLFIQTPSLDTAPPKYGTPETRLKKLFSGTALLPAETQRQLHQALSKGIVVSAALEHGPYLEIPKAVPVLGQATLSHQGNEELFTQLNIDQETLAQVKLSLFGAKYFTLHTPTLSLQQSQTQYQLTGVYVETLLGTTSEYFNALSTANKISITTSSQQLSAQNVAFSVNGKLPPEDKTYPVWKLMRSLDMKFDSAQLPGEKALSLGPFHYQLSTWHNKLKGLSLEQTLSLEDIKGDHPLAQVKKAQTHFKIDSIHQPLIDEVTKAIKTSDTAHSDLGSVIKTMIENPPKLELDEMSILTQEGDYFENSGSVTLNSETTLNTPNDVAGLVNGLEIEMHPHFSENLLPLLIANDQSGGTTLPPALLSLRNNHSGILDQFSAMGYMKKTRKGYKTDILLSKGELRLNDLALPLPDLNTLLPTTLN